MSEKMKVDFQKLIRSTVLEMLFELKKQGLMKDAGHNPFQKTEQLLYNYNTFNRAVSEKQKQIDFIKENGLQRKSKSITSFTGNNTPESKMDEEKAEEQIETLENSIKITKRYISVIDVALSNISNDKYYKALCMQYFEGISREEIAESFNVDVATITRNKNRLVNSLKIYLFSDEVIAEIFK